MSAEYSFFKPSGYDRATGLDGLPGTPTPPNTVVAKNNSGGYFFEELPESPTIERGEQTTIVHRFHCDVTTGTVIVQGMQRGQILSDLQGSWSKVLSCSLEYQRGDIWLLTVTAEGFSGVPVGGGVSTFDVPPDEFGVETLEFNPTIYLHPRYASVRSYSNTSTQTTGSQIIQWIQGAYLFPQQGAQTASVSQINSTRITDPDVLALAQELLSKVRQGIDTYYLAGFKVTYSYFFYFPLGLNPGGYIQDPVLSGALPSYFWSLNGTDSTADNNNCFLVTAKVAAPQFYAGGISWLRQADTISYQRTWFKITNIWIGAPAGHWDAELYSPTALPPNPTPPEFH